MNILETFLLLLCGVFTASQHAYSFCGFYVAKADTKMYNKASQVVLVRDEDKTVITMANDFKGVPKEFAVVVPVPTFIEREQINIGDQKIIDHLDAYSSPRLVEYFDSDPCRVYPAAESAVRQFSAKMADNSLLGRDGLGVAVEANYTVGEYDILILSAKESKGLEKWLKKNGYKIPMGASEILGSYIKRDMRFFVAKVNLKEQSKLGFTNLRPIQVAFESPKFMLPIRLGTVNANGPQELFVYVLNRKGRVETTNYRTVKLPTAMDIPVYVKDEFKNFYLAMFDKQVEKEKMKTVFLEYAWDMNWCDPCAADPLSPDELRSLGMFWLDQSDSNFRKSGLARNEFITRLHVRYDAKHFPEDLIFQETGDRTNFQGRHVLRHPWKGDNTCDATVEYHKRVRARQEQEAKILSSLTGWDIGDIRMKMGIDDLPTGIEEKWWNKIWKN
ncbi:MAG: DUF2330 domain-containing protein [Candidatus Dadabacteria bacterium]|nr:DUF2330 domain-containing protein [Candidatus Dadabacteria bacterium]NIS08949.1 DUF2330 domain-containing protein [Candidatus Dadabacteria bacterium]NIV41664.1 DUF2330 domain-containing protein [Candidatus Dadabacteria bacterium]NIY21388.1 DUF2330 domain-containing protein [Candidatus Dadabacteria bacterium]